MQGLPEGPWQHFLTMAGMVAVITSVLTGATAALLVAVAALVTLLRRQRAAWTPLLRQHHEGVRLLP